MKLLGSSKLVRKKPQALKTLGLLLFYIKGDYHLVWRQFYFELIKLKFMIDTDDVHASTILLVYFHDNGMSLIKQLFAIHQHLILKIK